MGLPGARPHHVLEGARRQISPATPFSSRFSRPLSARYVGRSARVRWAYKLNRQSTSASIAAQKVTLFAGPAITSGFSAPAPPSSPG